MTALKKRRREPQGSDHSHTQKTNNWKKLRSNLSWILDLSQKLTTSRKLKEESFVGREHNGIWNGPPTTSHLPCWWQLLRLQSTCMEQVASARRSHLGSSLKELWLCVWSGLVGPSRTGIRACFVSSDLKFSQSWSDFLGSFCQKHMKASTSCRRLQQGITVRTRNKQTSQEKAYKGKMGGKDMWRITYFKSSFLYWGMEKSMCISMAECMFRKDMSGP